MANTVTGNSSVPTTKSWSERRLLGVMGLLAVVTSVAASLSFGKAPDSWKSDELAKYVHDYRRALLIASILLALTVALSAAFFMGLRGVLRREEDRVAGMLGDFGAAAALILFAM